MNKNPPIFQAILIKIPKSSVFINVFVFELGVDKDGLATEYKLDESEGVTVANVAFAGLPIEVECIFSNHPFVVPRDVIARLNYINPFNKNFSQDYFWCNC